MTDAGGSENAADYLEKLQVTLCKILERIGFKVGDGSTCGKHRMAF